MQQHASSRAKPHSLTAKFIHWGFTALFIYALAKQLDELEELEDLALLHYELVFASIFLVLLITRFFFMRATTPTALPNDTPVVHRRMARLGHLALYASLGLIASSGLAIGGLFAAEVKSGTAMVVALGVHEIAVNACYFLVAGHIVAAIYHRYQGNGIWNSMVPVWKEPDAKKEPDVRNGVED